MSEIDQEALAHFGRALMEMVRDDSISGMDDIISGEMKGKAAEKIRETLREFSKKDIEALNWLVPQMVDRTIHHLLWMLEQNESINVTVDVNSVTSRSLRDISDGLCGELYDWIPSFSKQRDTEE